MLFTNADHEVAAPFIIERCVELVSFPTGSRTHSHIAVVVHQGEVAGRNPVAARVELRSVDEAQIDFQ